MAGQRLCLYVALPWSMVGLLAGVVVSALFLWHYENTQAAVWALLSAIFASVCFHLHTLCIRNRLHIWYSIRNLDEISFLGIFVLVIGMAGFTWYCFYALYYEIPLIPVKESAFVSAVCAFATAHWGLILVISSSLYRSLVRDILQENSPLLRPAP